MKQLVRGQRAFSLFCVFFVVCLFVGCDVVAAAAVIVVVAVVMFVAVVVIIVVVGCWRW